MNAVTQNRKLVLVGLGVVALAAALLVVRPLLLGSSNEPAAVASTPLPRATAARPATPKPAASAAKASAIRILPGVPAPVAGRLQGKPVVVVSLYVDRSSATLSQARAGAKKGGAGFVAVNLLNEQQARAVAAFAGDGTSSNATLVVQRPGKIVNRFAGYVDNAIVAQAAVNAGARPPKTLKAKAVKAKAVKAKAVGKRPAKAVAGK
jgi:hypothetical protein